MNHPENKTKPSRLSEIVKAIVILLFAGVSAYKLIITPINLSMDFYALLSLLLALFSVGLSALFYFKATDTSNAFYDNTYKFTKDIAELLVRIESGFGERLRHLDESYTRIQDRVYSQTSKEEIVETQKQVELEEKNLDAKLKERDKLVEELVQKSQLDEKDKQRFLVQLKQREAELHQLQVELSKLREQASELQVINQVSLEDRALLTDIRRFTARNVIEKISPNVLKKGNRNSLNHAWREVIPDLPRGFLRDLEHFGYIDPSQDLTFSGVNFFKELAFKRDPLSSPIRVE